MGRYGFHVIDADGHGGEETNWQDRVAAGQQPLVAQYRERIRSHYSKLALPGGGLARKGDRFAERPGMSDPAARLADMDLEGIDVTVTFPRGAGEEWALLDPDFAGALCRAINDSRPRSTGTAPRASRPSPSSR